MYARGSHFIVDSALQALGIDDRDKLDVLCHRELRPELNTYLHVSSVRDQLVWAAVNPDGERRESFDPLCYWFPKHKALLSLVRLLSSEFEPGSFEHKYSKCADVIKRYKAARSALRVHEQNTATPQDCLMGKKLEENAYLWTRSLEDEDLTWIPVTPDDERRKLIDSRDYWRPKAVAAKCLSELHNSSLDSFEGGYIEIIRLFRGFRMTAEIKFELIKDQLRRLVDMEKRQLYLKVC